MRRRIFVHVGTHKTGTTSIQFFLHDESARLARAGIFVPRAGMGLADAPAGHHNVAYELCRHPSYDPRVPGVAVLLEELRRSEIPTAVISSENLQFLHTHPEVLAKFDALLDVAGYDRTYLVFFRNREDYLLSLYTQLKITGRLPTPDFQGLRQRMLNDGYIVDRIGRRFEFDPATFTRKWESVTGPNLRVLDYDAATKSLGVVPAFLQAIGAPTTMAREAAAFPRFNVTTIGRNEPCPCQSGKRYKHCHGARA